MNHSFVFPFRSALLIWIPVALFFFGNRLVSQTWLYPETIQPTIPLLNDIARKGEGFLSSMTFWGEFGQYIVERDRDHRWVVSLGGNAELFRSGMWDLNFETNVHLVVDPNNNITFNPRAFIWEEGIVLGLKNGSQVWNFGYLHRCKHDVDNLELLRTSKREEERALIYGSIFARWTKKAMRFKGWDVEPLAAVHVYVIVQDQRFPIYTRKLAPSVQSFQGALRGRITASKILSRVYRMGATVDIRITTLGPLEEASRFSSIERIQVNPACEIFWDFLGKAAALRVFLRYTYDPDNFIAPQPRKSSLMALGLRLLNIP
ncbi:MAG: hypothetical protein GXO82_00310 [Chlorobi bacterium]|nr:hypothetical protein [Chlorobiota bacterium]